MKLEEAIKIIKDIDTLDDIELQEAYETVLHELEHLQKENEELKDIDLTTVHIKGVCDEKDRWRNKIRELILNKKQKIQENSKEIRKGSIYINIY